MSKATCGRSPRASRAPRTTVRIAHAMPAEFSSEALAQRFAQISERFAAVEAQLARLSAAAGLPYEQPAADIPAEVVEQVRAGNQLQAIRLYRQHTGASMEEAQKAVAGL